MNFKSFLIKYAEIAIKGKNRYQFEDALVHQIKNCLKKCDGRYHRGKSFESALLLQRMSLL